jgi:hypothetical protein
VRWDNYPCACAKRVRPRSATVGVLSNTFTWCRASPSPNASNGLISERMISMAQALHGLLSACAGLAIRRKAYKLELSLLRKLTGARTIPSSKPDLHTVAVFGNGRIDTEAVCS